MGSFIVALDQGTTSSRALLFDHEGTVRGVAQRPLPQYFPQPGWVEHDPREILSSQLSVFTDLLVKQGVRPCEVEGIGITNQRETTVVWDRATGEPVCNAIVWQCRRTADLVEALCSDPAVRGRIVATTGLVPDAYFSASKIAWILGNVPGAREAAEAGELMFGTVDSWLVWNLTDGAVHATDPTNASRTMLYDIHRGCWDPWLCDLFDVPMSMLPEVRRSSGDFGVTAHPGISSGLPICGVAGDQQAALFGQCCFEPGQAKNTYGTGCFLLMHTGHEAVASRNGLVTTIAASAPGEPSTEYALEGSVFIAGALMQWMRDELGLIGSAEESEALALQVPDTDGVYIVPAFTGLGAPYWDSHARGAVYGLTRGTAKAHIVRAGLESLAYQVEDLLTAMSGDAGMAVKSLDVDGGASRNDFLMRFQADVSQVHIVRPVNPETTAAGAAYLAGLACGFWRDVGEVLRCRAIDARFAPNMEAPRRASLLEGWRTCVDRTRSH